MPNLEWNTQVWGRDYNWPLDGDEWHEAADFCRVPYTTWKDQLIKSFAAQAIRKDSHILEIGPGHGRWSSMLLPYVPQGQLSLVDLNSSCIDFCKNKFKGHSNIDYYVNNGKDLSFIPNNTIDFVFSFDTFVHIEEPEIRSYITELKRVMSRQTVGVIHHTGTPTDIQRQNGMRSSVGLSKFTRILQENGLTIIRQTDSWDQGCNVKYAGDYITVFIRS